MADVADYFGEVPPVIFEDQLSAGEGTGSPFVLQKQYEEANILRSDNTGHTPFYSLLALKTPLKAV